MPTHVPRLTLVDVASMTIDSRAAACMRRRGGTSRALASENDTDDMLRRDVAGGALLREIAPCFWLESFESSLVRWDPPPASGRSKMVRVGAKRARKPLSKRKITLQNPFFLGEKRPKNENRTHTPPPPRAAVTAPSTTAPRRPRRARRPRTPTGSRSK